MANPNIVQTSSVLGKTDVLDVTSTPTPITENYTSSGKVFRVNTIIVSNIDTGGNVDVDVSLYRGFASYPVAKGVDVQANSSVAVIDRDTPIYLLEGDSVLVSCSSSTSAQAVCSYDEIS